MSMTELATKLHLKPETHEDFRKLCARSYLPVAGQNLMGVAHVHAAAVSFLEINGTALWPEFHGKRTHLLDTEGDTSWSVRKKKGSGVSKITGPKYMVHSKPPPAMKRNGVLVSKIGDVVRRYFEEMAKSPALYAVGQDEDVATLRSNVLAVGTNPTIAPDDGSDEAARELWLADAAALKSLAQHHLSMFLTGTATTGQVDDADISHHEIEVEQAVGSLLDTHGAALWPRVSRGHLQQPPTQRARQWVVPWTYGHLGSHGGPVHICHSTMDDSLVRAWVKKHGGREPNEREMKACSKIGQVLKDYFCRLMRYGRQGAPITAAQIAQNMAHLLAQPAAIPAAPAANGDGEDEGEGWVEEATATAHEEDISSDDKDDKEVLSPVAAVAVKNGKGKGKGAESAITGLGEYVKVDEEKGDEGICPITTCERRANGFTRLVNLKIHILRQHPDATPRDWCIKKGCWFSTQDSAVLREHEEGDVHGKSFEPPPMLKGKSGDASGRRSTLLQCQNGGCAQVFFKQSGFEAHCKTHEGYGT